MLIASSLMVTINLKRYLNVLNEELVSANGDKDKQLVTAMKSFCSAFARSNRIMVNYECRFLSAVLQ